MLTVAGANATIASVDAALATVSRVPESVGRHSESLHGGGQQPAVDRQNLTQSRSTIQDANFAQETANLTQAQVLEQAGISVLAQANQQPQLILKLLGVITADSLTIVEKIHGSAAQGRAVVFDGSED